MQQLLSKTLAQIVNENHQAAQLFEKYGLDFCCKGKRPLEIACNEKNLTASDIAAELEILLNNKVKAVIDFNEMSLTELATYIVSTHHQYVKRESPQILAYLHKIASKHGDRHPELADIYENFLALKQELDQHMFKEENILFPRISEIEKASTEKNSHINMNYLAAPVSVMEHEHDSAGNFLREIRDLTNEFNPPVDACTTYRLAFALLQAFELDLHQHIHLENNILFPKAIELLQQPGLN
jgi:regulator of cell morphogenesis and NO signaling